jgi:alkaline phosphatase D
MKNALLLSLAGAGGALASFASNINYFSPSLHHPELGVSVRKIAARTYAKSPWDPKVLNFTHGVASGDPYEDSVILWTRISPTSDNDKSNVTVSGHVDLYSHEVDDFVKASKAPVCVEWKISTLKDLTEASDSGTAYTSSDVDFTVKVKEHLHVCEQHNGY